MQPLSCAYHSIQLRLIPALDEVVGPLGERDRELVRAFELTAPLLPKVLGPSDYCGLGRPQANRHKLFRAFIAKSVMGFPTTELLIEQRKRPANPRSATIARQRIPPGSRAGASTPGGAGGRARSSSSRAGGG